MCADLFDTRNRLNTKNSQTADLPESSSISATETNSFGTSGSADSVYDVVDPPSHDLIDDLIDAGLLGDYGDKFDMLPLVDLWLDLPENMKEEDIPMPSELFAERDAVVRLALSVIRGINLLTQLEA